MDRRQVVLIGTVAAVLPALKQASAQQLAVTPQELAARLSDANRLQKMLLATDTLRLSLAMILYESTESIQALRESAKEYIDVRSAVAEKGPSLAAAISASGEAINFEDKTRLAIDNIYSRLQDSGIAQGTQFGDTLFEEFPYFLASAQFLGYVVPDFLCAVYPFSVFCR